ncbi:MAG: M48 family metalloprotease, partial [Gammaproteobacteria bacterium]|nr:M48 family metalloprotease [Gammaproteobacteria bacterium]
YFSANLQDLYGRIIYNEYYSSPVFIKIPIVDDYINNLGLKLYAHVTDSNYIPRFFVVRENSINAFAYPGGTIGVHSGLILASQTESELAGVLAHEISHVSQNHIARSIQNSAQNAPLQILTTLAALLAASQSSSTDAMAGTLAVTQGLFAQQSINFTRSQETEADQVGIKLMEKSGFSVTGFRDFFSRLAKARGTDTLFPIPEMLMTHPKPSSRIAETRSRMTIENSKPVANSFSYEMVKVLMANEHKLDSSVYQEDAVNFSDSGKIFDQAIKLAISEPVKSEALLTQLTDAEFHPYVHLQLAQQQLNMAKPDKALETVDNALRLFPNNALLSLFRAERLLEKGQNTRTIEELSQLQLFSSNPRIPALLAKAYEKQGNKIEAYYHISRHYYAVGDFYRAMYQLDNALATPGINQEQERRIQQRYDDIYNELPDKLREEIIRAKRFPNSRI